MLAHDLWSPITVAMGYADILDSSWAEMADDERTALLHKISAAGRSAQALLEDTLTVSAINGQGIVARPAPVRVDTVARAALESAGRSAMFDVGELRPATALVDPTHLQQVVVNLVSNAGKYGEPPFDVSVDEGPEAVTLRVSDSGRGVPPEFVPHLFDRFTRSEASRSGPARGTGLGRYIIRQLLSVNDGSIRYEETPGGGATFVLTLRRSA